MRIYGTTNELKISEEESKELINKKEELPSDINIEKGLSR